MCNLPSAPTHSLLKCSLLSPLPDHLCPVSCSLFAFFLLRARLFSGGQPPYKEKSPPGGGNLGGPETLKERNLGWNAAELHGVGDIRGKLTSREPAKQPSGLAWHASALAPPDTTRSRPDIVRFERGGAATCWSEGALPVGQSTHGAAKTLNSHPCACRFPPS